MDSRTQERVERWDSRAFSGGYDGLRDLVDSDFSGAVTAAGSWLFLLNGRVVGTVDGAIEDFENGSGTVYEAPHPSLPLLCTMEERGGETRAKYYTNETSLREVDRTLRDGSFTGYVELSENVLSGDYYVVYYGGRRMAAAYIGSAERLLTGDEAFERAADEVGIYEVTDVEIDVTDVPDATDADATESTQEMERRSTGEPRRSEPDGENASHSHADSATPEANPNPDVEPAPADGETPRAASGITTTDDADADRDSSAGITDAAPDEETRNSRAEDRASGPTSGRDEDPESAIDPDADGATEADTAESRASSDEADAASPTRDAPDDGELETGTDESATPDSDADADERTKTDSSPDPEAVEEAARKLDQQDIDWVDDDSDASERRDADELEERFEREEQWRETRRIPSIDPDDTETSESADEPGSAGRTDAVGSRSESDSTQSAPSLPSKAENGSSSRQPARQSGRAQDSNAASNAADDDRRANADQRPEHLENRRNALRTKVEALEAERDQLRSKNRKLASTVEQLRSRVEDLETELERARATTTERERAAGAQLSRRDALSQTNLFVRYASRSQPTLETAHDGGADRNEVESNLRLEYHTQFDETDAVVDGDPYEDALTSSMEYRFVDWLTSVVLYEIRDTGHADALGDLYDAIPRIDRAELRASISLADDETEDVPERVGFDVVAYDKMGNPLLVANLNDSREPASQAMLEEMEEAASAVKANYPDLAAAIVVTSSYFEPGALEVVERATSGGFLSRGSRLSYVNLSRKQGYHLCLAESRSEGFHMNVPEL